MTNSSSKSWSSTRVLLPSPKRPITTEATSDEQSQSRRHHRAASPTLLEQSDDRSSSPHPRMKDRPNHSQRKIEKFIHVQNLDKLIQKQVEGASMPHLFRVRAITINLSNSLFFRNILEYEFSKKFIILTFDCYSAQSDPIQHLWQY